MAEQTLYLSNDKSHVMDAEGKVVYVRKEIKGKTFYSEPAIEDKACQKACLEFKPKQVCIGWNANKVCVEWGGIEVCVKWGECE